MKQTNTRKNVKNKKWGCTNKEGDQQIDLLASEFANKINGIVKSKKTQQEKMNDATRITDQFMKESLSICDSDNKDILWKFMFNTTKNVLDPKDLNVMWRKNIQLQSQKGFCSIM